MAEFSDEEKKELLESAQSQKEIHTYLMGLNGNPGFCERVECQIKDYAEKYTTLDRNFWRLVAFLIGSGVLTAGGLGLFNILN